MPRSAREELAATGAGRQAAAPGVAREVSCRVLGVFFDAAAARGVPADALAEGCGYPAAHLMRPSSRIGWNAFVRFMENAGGIWSDDELAELGVALLGSRALRPVFVATRLLYEVSDAYVYLFGPDGPAARTVETELVAIRRLGPSTIELDVSMRPGYAPSRENFVVLLGTLRGVSHHLGFERARVVATYRPDGARYRIELPSGGGRLAWARRALTWPFAARSAAEELRAANEALYDRARESETLLDAMPVGCITSSPEGDITYVNPAIERIFGYQLPELLGRPSWEVLVAERDRDDAARAFVDRAPGVFAGVSRDGRPILAAWRHTQIPNDPRVLSTCADVTERRRLEDDLAQAQRMEAVGRLAAGVAHDFNNLLTVIVAGGGQLALDVAESDPRREDVDAILAAADQATALTRQLLALARRQPFAPRVVELRAAVRGLEDLVERLIGNRITLVFTGEATDEVNTDPEKLAQVVLNLAANARDAMPDGGTLSINVSPAVLSEPRRNASPGRYAVLTVRDTGTGIPDEVRPHLFEPFFTTKSPGRGTGLGLSTVYGTVRQSGGFVTVETTVGVGTSFAVWLPVRSP